MKRLDFYDVNSLAVVEDLVEPLRVAFKQGATAPPRGHYEMTRSQGAGTLLVMPSWSDAGFIGVKVSTVFPDNPRRGLPSIHGQFMLISGDTGKVLALIDGAALTLLRTAAVSALAADLLVVPDVERLLMVGTGPLARYLIRGHCAVRNFRQISVWGRDVDKAARLAAQLAETGVSVQVARDLEAAVRAADVVSCATSAGSPLIQGQWLRKGAHLDLVGGFSPSMREADEACFRDARLVVDTPDALRESGDLIEPLARGDIRPGDVVALGDLIAQALAASSPQRTVFKSVGAALADLAAAHWLFAQASSYESTHPIRDRPAAADSI